MQIFNERSPAWFGEKGFDWDETRSAGGFAEFREEVITIYTLPDIGHFVQEDNSRWVTVFNLFSGNSPDILFYGWRNFWRFGTRGNGFSFLVYDFNVYGTDLTKH